MLNLQKLIGLVLHHNITIVRTVLRPDDPVIAQVLEIDMGFNQSSANP